ncbi:MAG: hypothetical protein AVDCRST_MAG42-1370 [uncultured Chthoniobacterales bacterium]|uniref:Cyclic phosphodiesterase-like protein n=1 Tax=uncultured Chthoniobacterales bacterium TaxID=1836801 RepID=A0A6J4HLV1_9BACT|nr:MAG: hypothetical protein AVDCRST_MAG42-1370 [uncultured Chthoniobacterales bacterium]
MEQRKEKVAFWLMPAADARAVFASLVNDLAKRLHAPVFEPHVTLQGAELEERRAIEVLNDAGATSAPLQLQVAAVQSSEKYTKTLYVQFARSEEAAGLSNAITRAVGDNGYNFDPHLSLLYKTLPEAVKLELARETKIPLQQVSFDALQLVSIPRTIECAGDVRAWRTIAECRLTPTSK